MKSNFPNRRFFSWFAFGLLIVLLGFIPVRIAVTFRSFPTPQAIFVLGGNFERTKFAGKFWQSRRDLDIWVSDFPQYLDQHRQILNKFGVLPQQLHLDGTATDTVTNFTSLVDDFTDDNLQHIYLITSDYHMRRSRVIATVVLGSRGVVVTPVSLASGRDEDESLVKVVRDFGRSLLWVVSGKTGAGLNPRLD
ncbi:YdcF family protein [Rivularia sp. UHCC 0363]|uniref:YdcF family protein n=1 Tax=Rivularia sp. UHCC 0363 TaxID=3110244 RepID=UPI002B2190F2|nr:YdcF family protein [Rivularia sp. UHCC 0363]MEA5598782.1 YdcF family protein [Rivularia sp. UHCC 0363]